MLLSALTYASNGSYMLRYCVSNKHNLYMTIKPS